MVFPWSETRVDVSMFFPWSVTRVDVSMVFPWSETRVDVSMFFPWSMTRVDDRFPRDFVFTQASVEEAVRTCPLCRTPTHAIVPSKVFPASKEIKDRLVLEYRDHLAQLECKHFNHGDGACPFGVSCFYRHTLRDGTLATREVRTATGADGLSIVREVRLSDFLDTDKARNVLR